MAYIRVVVKHGEAIVRPDQPELLVRGEVVSPGEEKSFEVSVEEPLMIEAQLTEEMEKQALELEEADERVAKENEIIREEKELVEEERQAKRDWSTEQAVARREGREPDKGKEYKKKEWAEKKAEAEWEREQKLAELQEREPDESKKPQEGRAAQQYQGKKVRKVRDAKEGDKDWVANTDQVVVTLEDGSEKTVKRSEVQAVKPGTRSSSAGYTSSPAPKAESPPKPGEARSGIDSKEVKGEAPMSR